MPLIDRARGCLLGLAAGDAVDPDRRVVGGGAQGIGRFVTRARDGGLMRPYAHLERVCRHI